MDSLEEQLLQLSIMNSRPLSPLKPKCSDATTTPGCSKVATLVNNLQQNNESLSKSGNEVNTIVANSQGLGSLSAKKVRPIVPPKPHKKEQKPEVPQSIIVKQASEPLYSQRLQCLDSTTPKLYPPILQRKQPVYVAQKNSYDKISKVSLDNPAILEQQLEALAHHKKQLEKKGLLVQHQESQKSLKNTCVLKPSSSFSDAHPNILYSNMRPLPNNINNGPEFSDGNMYSNVVEPNQFQLKDKYSQIDVCKKADVLNTSSRNNLYCNVLYEKESTDNLSPSSVISITAVDPKEYQNSSNDHESEIPLPPSPVSSSYSELRRATEICSKKTVNVPHEANKYGNNKNYEHYEEDCIGLDKGKMAVNQQQSYMNMNYNNEYSSYSPNLQSISQDSTDYYGYGSFSQGSSTYESIYEPINPRPPSQLSSRSNYLMYAPYENVSQILESGDGILCKSSSNNISSLGVINTSNSTTPVYPSGISSSAMNALPDQISSNNQKEAEVESLADYLVHSMNTEVDADTYGICFKCKECVLGENSGCTAMDQIYHIACFTCSQCQINLQGKPFYVLDDKPFCEYDYLQTLEKCSVCMKPILERILRATGKPYHPQCFTCIVCDNSLDGIPFTVDATNQNYCIADFHKKFAPRCCVCKEPIMPEPGEEETVRVVALDRSFHFECYKCEDCGLLLSSEAEGRGCYPLDDHVLCKSCNAKRVQMLTNRMTTEL